MGRLGMRMVLAVVLLACASPVAGAQPASSGMADTTAMDWSRIPEYRIVPGDVLSLNFGPLVEDADNDLIREVHVRPDGRISVYPVGEVVAAGLTPIELQKALVSMLASYLRDPRIGVEISEFAGNKVHVMGRVKKPGSYVAAPFMTLSQAVSEAGGFEDDAASNSVLLIHRDGARSVRVARVALGTALKKGRMDADLMVHRFDIVFVPRSTIGNIDVFCRQFFGETISALNFALVGWELFNLDRVFVTTVTPR